METLTPTADMFGFTPPALQDPPEARVGFARVVLITNPFDAFNSMEVVDVHSYQGMTLRKWLFTHFGPEFVEFERPTICFVNGQPFLREQWDTYEFRDGDLIQFLTRPGDVVSIVIAVIALVVAAVAILLIPTPTVPGGQPQPDPVFTRSGQYNRSRPGEPIEVGYGRCRLWPSYGGRSYTLFANNDQYQYNLFCLGQGYWDIEQVYIEDTAIEDFAEVEVEFVEPGNAMTLFHNNVETSTEIAGIELYGPNQEEYDGYAGPFILNASGTTTDRIEFDTVCPQGLYKTSKKGDIKSTTVTFEFEIIKVDNGGEIIDGETWESLGTIVLTDNSTTPQRRTWRFDVIKARYKARARRLNEKSESIRVQHTIQWAGARAFLPNVDDFGGVTMMAVKIRASNNINDNTRSLFNVVATRILPTYDVETGLWAPAAGGVPATRSIVMAFCDVFRARYGGRDLGRFLNMEQLMEMDAIYEARGEYFDWIFDQKTTVAEAAKAIARVGRGVPVMLGNRMGIVRDAPASLPTSMFGPDNIVAGSFRREFKFFEFDPTDCVEMEYRNPDTWEVERVTCALPGSTTDNPNIITFSGCVDRNHAYHEGMYLAAMDRYVRERVSFATGLEGHIPQYGDLISVSHDLIRVGSSGLVLSIDNVTNPTHSILSLSDPVNLADPATVYVIVIREKNGDVHGPLEVEPAAYLPGQNRKVAITPKINLALFPMDDNHELPLYQFGSSERYAKLCKVSGLRPSSDDTVEVECVNYDARLHIFDELDAPPLYPATTPPPIPGAPVAFGLRVNYIVDNPALVNVSWGAAYGAVSYVLEQSNNGTSWTAVAATALTSYSGLAVTPGYLYLRVAAINIGQGLWNTWEGEVGMPLTTPPPPTGFANTNTWALDAAFIWDTLTVEGGFDLTVLQFDTETIIRNTEFAGEETNWTYTRAMALADGADRKLIFALTAGNIIGDSEPVEIVLENALPAAPTALVVGAPAGTVYPVSWAAAAEVDFKQYKVYKSTTNGFTPGPGNLVYTGTVASTTIETAGVTTYWKVSNSDVWGDEEVFSAQGSIVI